MTPVELLDVFAESYLCTPVSAEFLVLVDSETIWDLMQSWMYANDLDDSKFTKNDNIIEFPTIKNLADFSEYLYDRLAWSIDVRNLLPQANKLSCWIHIH